jgi:leucyl aminopeptidase
LTGAARVALGPDLPATFANRDDLADALMSASARAFDPLWRMPLWDPYDEQLKSDVADLSNTSGNAMAGAVYAALFLRRFVPDEISWAHLDTFAWRDSAKPGRPKGGEALGLRAVFAALEERYPRA